VLTALAIRDFAIISALDLRFEAGLTVVTGETGAGKSIVLDAMALIAGARADAGVVRAGAERAELSAEFALTGLKRVMRWLKEAELDDAGSEVVQLRRVVRAEGSSKAWINGRAVPLTQLRELAEQLVEIHGQHDSIMLQEPTRQLAVLDHFAATQNELQAVRESAASVKSVAQETAELKKLSGAGTELLELLTQQLNELAKQPLAPEQLAELDQKQRKLANAEALIDAMTHVQSRLDRDAPQSAARQLAQVQSELRKFAAVDAKLLEAAALIESAVIEIDEAAALVEDVRADLALDPKQLAQVEAALSKVHELARKHRVPVNQLAEKAAEIKARVGQMSGAEERLAALAAARENAERSWREAAAALSSKRQQAAKKLARAAEILIQNLGMAGGKLAFEFQSRAAEDFSATGAESGEFVVCANPGQALKPMRKTASGGELSRLSLALKVASLTKATIPVLLFDEVDAGIGGAVADTVGQLLAKLGREHQVLVVTHLAQVAAYGAQHCRVSKTNDGLQTQSSVQLLNDADRIDELARMLGGQITPNTRATASEMRARALSSPR
jgi:DNA repair protein RecN (Recombination protein N)